MGARMYYIKREENGWKRLYSHWGADYIKDHIKQAFQRKEINAIEEMRNFLKDLENHEIEYKNEQWEEFNSDLKEIIDLEAIDIELYIIDTGDSIFIVLPFISSIHGCIIAKIYSDAYENYKTLWIYREFQSYIKVIEQGVKTKKISEETAKKIAKSFFMDWVYEPSKFRYLVFEKHELQEILNIIEGKAYLIPSI